MSGARAPGALRRTLGFWVLLLYGLGIVIGAGIYVLVGTVAANAGMLAPLAFLAAGALAVLTGLSYAELVTRIPEASGSVGFVHAGFRSKLAGWITGFAVLAATAISGSAIARGSAGYVGELLAVPEWLPGTALVAAFTLLACLKVEIGARVAAAISALEIAGLIAVMSLGADALAGLPQALPQLAPRDGGDWLRLAEGAFVAFFAYIGFETLANMAEETRDVARTLPRAIMAAIAAAATIYGLVALIGVLAVPLDRLARSGAPLCLVIERAGLRCGAGFAALALLALSNGVLVEIILLARLLYGMAERGLLPAAFGAVDARSGVPVRATLIGGGAMLALVATLPFAALAGVTSALTLAVFAAVNAALVAIKWRERGGRGAVPAVVVPLAVPVAGCLACLVVLAAALLAP